MANCNNLFDDFNSKIRLTDTKRTSLKKSRNALRKKIRAYMKDYKPNEKQPKFWGQGSFMMDTIINPIPVPDGNGGSLSYYDLDDGIYFLGDISDRKAIGTYHKWIVDAVSGHTGTLPIDKSTCVRTIFSDGHNIDQPIYYISPDETPELAHKIKSWIISDPREFTQWFNDQADKTPQLRRIVRYLKAWANFKPQNMPSGLILTILATENYCSASRDDIALRDTLKEIEMNLQNNFSCYRPTVPDYEDLLENYKNETAFMSALATFIKNADNAIENKNQRAASEYWIKCFGSRFNFGEDKDEQPKASSLYSVAVQSKPHAE